MLRIAQTLEAQLRAAMQQAFPEADGELNPALGPASKPEFGDFQANGALALAKPLKQAPRQIAAAIVEQLQNNPEFSALAEAPQIAGPGFINITLKPSVLAAEVRQRIGDPRLGVAVVEQAEGQYLNVSCNCKNSIGETTVENPMWFASLFGFLLVN